jgi:phosphoglycerate dehydrogenase-like enzyme
MKKLDTLHHLLIVSQHFEIYKQLIEQASLPGLSIIAVSEPGQAIRLGYECDLVFGEPALVGQVLNSLPKVRWVQTSWAGVEPLMAPDVKRDYILTNARNVYGPMMAEYVFGYLLMIERRVIPRWQSQLNKKWDDRLSGTLKGKKFGLLGVGTIGAYLAGTARSFGMHTYGYTRQSETCCQVDRYFHGDSRRNFAADLDYLICTLPGTVGTKGIVNADFLSSLPPRAWLVNIGRGSTVDEFALAIALNNDSLAGAILDVFTNEPLPPDNPLWSTPNTFITYHTAARNYPPDIAAVFIENYKLLMQGKPLLYQVNFEQGY